MIFWAGSQMDFSSLGIKPDFNTSAWTTKLVNLVNIIGSRTQAVVKINDYGFALRSPFLNYRLKKFSKLDPVSRVTGIPGWYWTFGIKCSDTMGVGPVNWNSELKSEQGHTPISKHRHAIHARVFFRRVCGLLETLYVVFILKKGKKSINTEKNENVELPHTQAFCSRLCVLCE